MSRSTLVPPSRRAIDPIRPSLTEAQVTMLRHMLEQQRAFRLEQLAELHRPGVPGLLGSTDDEVFTSLSTGARAALRDVQHALWRMDEGGYGLCTACAAPLRLEVLEVLPQAALCLPCQRATTDQRASVPGNRGGGPGA
ncbi:MAG TPA: hypothetical protein VGN18_05235 [Jatrophihabitans sp.]|jgi:RNA polymerase-binding transcription factor DksA|uniref:TraR/DksA family transcriptional regulator n=1 Tax=Jatrophihabitans sp. TaxID=1932789 RepID=UPI002DFAFAC2|nr:hypothetical protein [Jatrophihabitans sp.]